MKRPTYTSEPNWGIDCCYYCGRPADQANMTSDCQVGLLCDDSIACAERTYAYAAAWLAENGVEL